MLYLLRFFSGEKIVRLLRLRLHPLLIIIISDLAKCPLDDHPVQLASIVPLVALVLVEVGADEGGEALICLQTQRVYTSRGKESVDLVI
jgi:hypothetical protein